MTASESDGVVTADDATDGWTVVEQPSHVSYLAVPAFTGVCSPSAIIRLGNQYNLNNLLLAHNSSRRRLMPSNLSTTYFRVAAATTTTAAED